MTDPSLSEKWYRKRFETLGVSRFFLDSTACGDAVVVSEAWESLKSGILRARTCNLHVPGRFTAETLVIYPAFGGDFPIFGSEYIKLPNRTFGAIDFHPVNGEKAVIRRNFGHFAPRTVEKSPHYDLNTHFSDYLWHKKSENDVYNEFEAECGARLDAYLSVLSRTKFPPVPYDSHVSYDTYMAQHDPAHGILKSYFGPDFAHAYVYGFLFEKARYVCDGL